MFKLVLSQQIIYFIEEPIMTTDEKRGITYQIAKNKGLTPRRKKELRNPRVKNRMKYRKAKIRRKGQVRLINIKILCLEFHIIIISINNCMFFISDFRAT